MLDKGRISSIQLALLLFMAESATTFLYVPGIAAKESGPDSWLCTLIFATIYGLLVAFICTTLAQRFPSYTFTEYLPQILGKIPGKILAFIFTLVLIHLTSVVVTEGADFMQVAFLSETPIIVLQLLLCGVALYGTWLGIEVISRHNELVFPIFLISFLILLSLLFKDIDLNNFKPVLENGILPVLKGSMVPASWRGEVFFILMLYPYLNQKKEALKITVSVVIFIAIFTTLITGAAIGVFNDQVTFRMVFPVYSMAEYISVARILERLEILIVLIWMVGIIIKLAIFFHSTCTAAATTLGINNYRITALPIVTLTLILANILYDSYLKTINFLSVIWPPYALTIELILPALLLLIATFKKKGE